MQFKLGLTYFYDYLTWLQSHTGVSHQVHMTERLLILHFEGGKTRTSSRNVLKKTKKL